MMYINKIKHEEENSTAKYSTVEMDEHGIVRIRQQEINFPRNLTEHMEYALRIEDRIGRMVEVKITNKDIIDQVKKMNSGKAAGPDGSKIEIMKIVVENDIILNKMCTEMNRVIEERIIPEQWKESNTSMIPKCKKPQITDMRPIALTNVSYKIFMGIIKKKIENHLIENRLINELQTGATKGANTLDNIYILQNSIDMSFKEKESLYIISADFAKAFDSVDRKCMIGILKEMKIDYKIIDIITYIYTNDFTNLEINKKKVGTIEITSGIRQGCTASALLFILITYKIINKLKESRLGYRKGTLYIPALFYMDDGLILARNLTEIKEMMTIFTETAENFGLRLNKKKCKAMIFNGTTTQSHIDGIEITDEILYLGIKIRNARRWDKEHIESMIGKARRLSNQIYQITGKCCNRMLVGKTFWKGVALPNFLYGQEIARLNNYDTENLQKIENVVYRNILNVPKYTGVEFLRGEVGSSSMKWRIIKGRLLYIHRKLTDEKDTYIKKIIKKDIELGYTEMGKRLRKEILEAGLTARIETYSRSEIISAIKEKDRLEWISNMRNKVTLKRYMENKVNILEEKWFKNANKYTLIMKGRSDTLNLKWREWGSEEEKICPLCRWRAKHSIIS